MAAGDAVVVFGTGLAAGAIVTYQPAAGVEVQVRAASVGDNNAMYPNVGLTDGTNYCIVERGDLADPRATRLRNLFITNSVRLFIRNGSGTTSYNYCMSGVQTK